MQLLAELCGPRWKLPRREVLDMTRGFIAQVLWHPRDREGSLMLPQAGPGRTHADEVRVWLEVNGWPPHLAEKELRRILEDADHADPGPGA